MATTNKRVQGYVPGWISDALANYQKERGLNQSQAVEEILAAFFRGSIPTPGAIDSSQQEKIDRLTETVQSLERLLDALLERMDSFDDALDYQKQCIDSVSSRVLQIPSVPAPEPQPMTAQDEEKALSPFLKILHHGGSDSGSEDDLPILSYLAPYIDPVEVSEPEPEPVRPEPEPEPEAEVEPEAEPDIRKLSHAALARRLGVTPATLRRSRESLMFESWAKKKDLQGILWKYDSVGKFYLGRFPS